MDFANVMSGHSKEPSQMEPENVCLADLDVSSAFPPLLALRAR